MKKVVEGYTGIVDGVKELHLQLDRAYEKALKLHDELLGKSEQRYPDSARTTDR